MQATTRTLAFEHLPIEQQLEIFSFLPPQDVVKARLVCSQWDERLKDSSIWRGFYIKLVPISKRDSNLMPLDYFPVVIERIKKLIPDFKIFDTPEAIKASIKLRRIGITHEPSIEFAKFKEAITNKRENYRKFFFMDTYNKDYHEYAKALIKRYGEEDYKKMNELIFPNCDHCFNDSILRPKIAKLIMKMHKSVIVDRPRQF